MSYYQCKCELETQLQQINDAFAANVREANVQEF